MAVNRKRLVFFERWFDAIAEEVLAAQDDIELVKLHYADPPPDNWSGLSTACGYQISARTELQEPWFGNAALLERCDFVIANDTGLMHIADALGKPSVLMLGPTSAEMGCLPFHPLAQVLEHRLWCRPCSKNGEAPCIRSRRFCLERTTVDDVFRAAGKVAEALA